MLSDCPACRTPCDQGKRRTGSPVAEKAPLRPVSTRPDYQTFRCDCSHRRGTPEGPTLSRKLPPSSECRSSVTLHTCRGTARLLGGRVDNDYTRHGLVPERSDQPRSPHSRQTPTPHSTPRPHQCEYSHAGKSDRRAAPRPRRPRLGARCFLTPINYKTRNPNDWS